MKSIIKMSFIMALSMLMLNTSAYAAAVVVDDVKSGIKGQSVLVEGKLDGAVLNTITYNVRKMSQNENEWVIGDDIIAIGQIECESGEFSKNIVLPDDAPDGRYNVHIGTVKGQGDDIQVDYISKVTRNTLCTTLSNADVNGVIDTLYVEANIETATAMGIDINKYLVLAENETQKLKTAVASLVVNGLHGEFTKPYSESDLSKLFNYAASYVETVNSNDVLAKLAQNKGIFGVDYTNNPEIPELAQFIKSADITNGTKSISKAYNEALVIIAFNKEADYKNVMTLINDNQDIVNITLSAYENLSYQSKLNVQKEMLAQTYTSIADIKNRFNSLVEKYKSNNSSSGGSSGGGGGGGVSSGKVSAPSVAAPVYVEQPENIFTDMKNVQWANEAVLALKEMGVIDGVSATSFEPKRSVKREEFVKMIILAFFADEKGKEIDFSDVDKNAWYYEYISAAVQNGITDGYPDGSFGVGKEISRQDIAVMLERVAKAKGKVLNTENKNEFTDKDSISDYAKEAIESLSASGIIKGNDDGTFLPHSRATRAEAAKLIYELYQL